MKKIIILILLCFVCGVAIAQDRIMIQVHFKKGVFACPGGDEVIDWNPAGGNKYEHTCKDGTWLNSFREYNGVLSYLQDEYPKVTTEEIEAAKNKMFEEWDYQFKNPPPYIEPSIDELIAMRSDALKNADDITLQIVEKADAKTIETMQLEMQSKADYLDSVAVSKTTPIIEEPIIIKTVK